MKATFTAGTLRICLVVRCFKSQPAGRWACLPTHPAITRLICLTAAAEHSSNESTPLSTLQAQLCPPTSLMQLSTSLRWYEPLTCRNFMRRLAHLIHRLSFSCVRFFLGGTREAHLCIFIYADHCMLHSDNPSKVFKLNADVYSEEPMMLDAMVGSLNVLKGYASS